MVDAVTEDDLATLIYTSGTTGRPKGVELTHGNWLGAARAVTEVGLITPDDLHFLWLPMSHSFGKLLEVAVIAAGTPTVIDGRLDHISANLGVVRPTVMAAAPRIFEKIHNTVAATVQREGGIKLRLFRWARAVGIEVSRARQEGRALSPACGPATRSPTGWSSPGSAPGSAGGCATSSPARRRSRGRWPSSSTRPG
nr:hypothetical protein GCM10020093_003090 [Planobispora longispora]